jgi:hypothetical protein
MLQPVTPAGVFPLKQYFSDPVLLLLNVRDNSCKISGKIGCTRHLPVSDLIKQPNLCVCKAALFKITI